MPAASDACAGCGLVVAGGTAGCQLIMDELTARGFSDVSYGRVHRLFVDTYCLQHPDPYCVSFKSFAAHLSGVCWSLEHGGSPGIVNEALRKWVERHPHLEKPVVPDARGSLTVADVARASDAAAHVMAVGDWARSTWSAYSALHGLVRGWVHDALEGGGSKNIMKRSTSVLLLTMSLGLAGRASAQQATDVDRAGWDRAAAAKYLDDRMDAWFTNATKLRTGDDKTACVSCHTPLPYALARAALRRAMRISTATPGETRLLDETSRRVESYGTHQLLYELNDVKKAESRGTEAVLNAVIVASADAAERRREPSETTQKALTRLWETQRPDGAWDWLNFKLEPYESVDAVYHGATLAALAVGIVPGYTTAAATATPAGVGRLRTYLRDNFAAQSLYNRTFALLASSGFKDLLTGTQRDTLIAELVRRQRDDGGWSLEGMGPWRWSTTDPPFKPQGTLDASLLEQSDGFATGLIVHAMMRAGLHADHPAVAAGVRWLKTHQQEIRVDEQTWTAWRAYSLNLDREHGGPSGEPWRRLFMSDAASAFAVLALVDVESPSK